MPTSPLKEFEYEIFALMPEDRVMMINFKLDHLQKKKKKSNDGDKSIINYYIHELTKMKDDAYKYPIYSHIGVYLPEYGVIM